MADINTNEGTILEALNNKADLDLNNITPPPLDYIINYKVEGTEWYRLYKSGWVEQGGQSTVNETSTNIIPLHIEMKDTNYSINVVQVNISTNSDTEMGIGINPTSTTTITAFSHYINPNTATIRWCVSGFKKES